MPLNPIALTPTHAPERITLLDALRGIAVLGILIMNIPGFSIPYVQIFDPAVKGEMEGLNFYAYYLPELILEGSQRAFFSLLFGASVLLFLTRLEGKMDGLKVAEYFVRRQLWLLVFGLFNAYILLWYWDILFHYAFLGIILFAFRSVSPKGLIIAAIICLCFASARENVRHFQDYLTIRTGRAVEKIDTTKTKLTPLQIEQRANMNAMKKRSEKKIKLDKIEKNIKLVQSSYADLYSVHSEKSYEMETSGLFYFIIWDGLIFMLLGMAFYKNGIILGEGTLLTYSLLAVFGLGIGIPLSYYRLQPMIEHNFNYFDMARSGGVVYYELSRVIRALGIFGLIMVCYKSGMFRWLFLLFRPVGQMAFTNYLLQSLICGFIFYGVGLGYFGKLERYQTYYVVLGVWMFEIALSHLWLRYFSYGPLEWLWRCLTYWKWYPIRYTAIKTA